MRQQIQSLSKRGRGGSKDENNDESDGSSVTRNKMSKKFVLHPVYGNNDAESKKTKSSQSSKDKDTADKDRKTGDSKIDASNSFMSMDTSEDEKNRFGIEPKQPSLNIKLSKSFFMTTDQPYPINMWKTVEDDDEEIIEKCKNSDINLEVPAWVEKPLPDYDSSAEHGTFVEDTSEEVYLKRHLKFELDERRRKKWDVQRIREQKNIEKLKKRHLKEEYANEYLNTKASKTINSFFPQPETVKYIQVSENLPVHAFGELIPKLNPKEFSYEENSVYKPPNSPINYLQNNDLFNASLKFRTKFVYSSSQATRNSNEQKKRV